MVQMRNNVSGLGKILNLQNIFILSLAFIFIFLYRYANLALTSVAFLMAALIAAVFSLVKLEIGLYILLLSLFISAGSYFKLPTIGFLSASIFFEICLFFAFLIQLVFKKLKLYLNTPQNKLLLIYSVIAILPIFLRGEISEVSLWHLREYFLPLVFVYLAVANIIDSKKQLNQLLTLIIIGDIVLLLSSYLDYVGLIKRHYEFYYRGHIRIAGMIGNPNVLSFILTAYSPIMLTAALRRGVRPLKKLFLIMLLFYNILVILGTLSRGGLLALSFMFAYLIFKFTKNVRLMVLFAMLAVFGYMVFPHQFASRIGELSGVSLRGIDRIKLASAGLAMAMDHPFLGVGYGNWFKYFLDYNVARFPYLNAPHNTYVYIAAETGFPNLFVFLMIFVITWRQLSRIEKFQLKNANLKEDNLIYLTTIAIKAIFVGAAVFSLTADLVFSYVLYLMIALASILWRLYLKEIEIQEQIAAS